MSKSESIVGTCLKEVRKSHRKTRRSGIQSFRVREYDRITQEMLNQFMDLPEATRREISENLTREESGLLLGIAMGAAIWSIREEDPRRLKFGLIALILENCAEDYRETLMMLCLLDNSAKKLGIQIDDYYSQLRSYASANIRELFDSYLKMSPRDISAMGFVEAEDESGGFTYKRTW